jgi:MscS family membrane protein
MALESIFAWLIESMGLTFLENIYAQASIILIVFMAISFGILPIIGSYVKYLTKKTKTKADDKLFKITRIPIFYLILFFGVRLSIAFLAAPLWCIRVMDSIVIIFFMVLVIRITNLIIDLWGEAFTKKTKARADELLLPLFHKMVNIFLVILAALWILSIWKINVTPYLAGLGIGGLALGLALQDSLKNIFGGISLVIDQTFEVGDKIKLESGEVGTVYDISLRSTRVKTYDNEIITIPNGVLANSRVWNYTDPNDEIRVNVEFGVNYKSDPKKVKKVILEVLESLEDILDDPSPSVSFIEMGDFALKFKAHFWVAKWDTAYGKKLEATEKIFEALRKNKIDIPFPTYNVNMKK